MSRSCVHQLQIKQLYLA